MSARGAPAMVWLLEDRQGGAVNQALGIVERLGVGFRRIPLSWRWLAQAGAAPGAAQVRALPGAEPPGIAEPRGAAMLRVAAGHAAVPAAPPPAPTGARAPGPGHVLPPAGPALLIASGARAAAAALCLKARLGCPVVQILRPPGPLKLVGRMFDALVIPRHDQPPPLPNILPVLGLPHRVSPLALAQARAAWHERLEHLPRPRIVLLVGGPARGTGLARGLAPGLAPGLAHTLALQVGRMAQAAGGCVLAVTTHRTGAAAEDALAAGLSRTLHVLARAGDPGPDPYLGFLATADAVVVTSGSIALISEACATAAPVLIALPSLAAARQRHFLEALYAAGQARALGDTLAPWPRQGLDEAGRIAGAIVRQFPLE